MGNDPPPKKENPDSFFIKVSWFVACGMWPRTCKHILHSEAQVQAEFTCCGRASYLSTV